jgi:hypothetical protein
MKAQPQFDEASVSPLDIIRPVLWLAAVAFVTGFGGYLMLVPRAIRATANF